MNRINWKTHSSFIANGLFIGLFLLFSQTNANAQAPVKPSSAKIFQDIKKLNVLGNVLYIAAHPDDENTAFIAYMANEKLYNTGYLSFTRGDGGQNLIGPEIREGLGIIRTQELMQARRIDGGNQFFSHAVDFGFSKNPEEVFTIWDKEELLADAVWVIRNFKPDVMVTRFPIDSRAGHGHHSASSILAEEAFDAAADPNRFPEQLKYVGVWQAKRLLWNTSSWAFGSTEEFDKYVGELLKIDLGVYNPLLGKSYGEISAESRSMHKSQGFGSISSRGSSMDYFQHTKGEKASIDLFEGVNTTWSRVLGGENIERIIDKSIEVFDPSDPSAVVPILVDALKELENIQDDFWRKTKAEEIKQVIKDALGLYLEVTANDFSATPGEMVTFQLEAINRSSLPIILQRVGNSLESTDSLLNQPLLPNKVLNFTTIQKLPESLPYTQLYWLRKKGTLGSFVIEDQMEVGLPENNPAITVTFELEVAGLPMEFMVPVVHKRRDPVLGEVYRPFVVTPPIFINLKDPVVMFASQEPKTIEVLLKAGKDNVSGNVELEIPTDWRSEPQSSAFVIPLKGGEHTVVFNLFPPENQQESELSARVSLNGEIYNKSLAVVDYNHFPAQTYFPDATAKIVKLDLDKKGEHIGYIMGAGDDIPNSLKQIGYKVTLLRDEDMHPTILRKYDAIIIGVRAYNTVERLQFYQDQLMDYVKDGGNLIVQYNTAQNLKARHLGPYPFNISRDRVTVENSEVRFLIPDHSVLNKPNKISSKDFEGWVQERGLYFPNEWSSEYEAIISTNDPGDPPSDGGLLIAKYGKGNYIYTGYSWFRELPAGVPGAYRLFTNLISIGK